MSNLLLLGCGGPVSAPPGGSLLLDTYSGAVAAYSLRKLRTAYSGSAIRIRRSNDNAEQDIGFSSDLLDTSAITSFVSSNSAYVVTWYDQSGNSRDATQATASNQPRIVNAGTIETTESKPIIRFLSGSGTQFVMTSASYSSLAGSNFTMAFAYDPRGNNPFEGMFDSAPSNANVFRFYNDNFEIHNNAPVVATPGGDGAVNGSWVNLVVSPTVPSNRVMYYISSGTESNATNASTSAVTWVSQPRIGSINSSGNFCDGKIGEIILWPLISNSSDRVAVWNNLDSHY